MNKTELIAAASAIIAAFAALAFCIAAPAASGEDECPIGTATGVEVLNGDRPEVRNGGSYYIESDMTLESDRQYVARLTLYIEWDCKVTLDFDVWYLTIFWAFCRDGDAVEYNGGLKAVAYTADRGCAIVIETDDILIDGGAQIEKESSVYGILGFVHEGHTVFYAKGASAGEFTHDGTYYVRDGTAVIRNAKGSIALSGIKCGDMGLVVDMDSSKRNAIAGKPLAGTMSAGYGTFTAEGALDLSALSSIVGWIGGSVDDAKYFGYWALSGYKNLYAYGSVGGGYADDAMIYLRNATFDRLMMGSCNIVATAENVTTYEDSYGILVMHMDSSLMGGLKGAFLASMDLKSGSFVIDQNEGLICLDFGRSGSAARIELKGDAITQVCDSRVYLDLVLNGKTEGNWASEVMPGGRLTVNGEVSSGELNVHEGADLIVTERGIADCVVLEGRALVEGAVRHLKPMPASELTVTGVIGSVDLQHYEIPRNQKWNAAFFVTDWIDESSNACVTTLPRAVEAGAERIYVLGDTPRIDCLSIPAGVTVSTEKGLKVGNLELGAGAVLDVGTSADHDLAVDEQVTVDEGASLTVQGCMSAKRLKVDGSLTVHMDLLARDVDAGGSVDVRGSMGMSAYSGSSSVGAEASSSLHIDGSLNVEGDLSCDEATVGGSLDVGGKLEIKSIKVNGRLDVEGEIRTGTFVAEKGHDVSGDISAETIIVPAGVEFVSGCNLDADALIVLGTFRAEIPFSAEKIFVGMSVTSDSPSVGSASALIVAEGIKVMGLSALYVAEGSTAEGLTESMAATKYIVDGIAYATGYMPYGGSAKISDLRVPAFNGTVASEWACSADGKETLVGDMPIGGAGEVHASLCAVAVSVGEGFAKVFIDKAEVPVNGGSVSLSPGTHTLSWETESGYAGKDVAVSYNGQPVSGRTITVADSDGTAGLSLACAQDGSRNNGQQVSAIVIAVLAVILAAAAAGCWALKR